MTQTTKTMLVALLLMLTSYPFVLAQNKIEAEDGTYNNCEVVTDSKFSGGKALRMTQANAKLTIHFDAQQGGKYNITVCGNGVGGDKVVNCTVNGSTGTFHLNDYAETQAGVFIMQTGDNSIMITPNWTWFEVDYVVIERYTDSLPFEISDSPVDALATEACQKMYTFLRTNFGRRCISGIMTGDMSSANGNVTAHADVRAVFQASGKTPALIGFDFMNATGRDASNSWNISYTRSAMDLAKDTYRRGGFPAFTWHWRDPSHSTSEFYTNASSVKITDAMNADGSWNTSSALYQNIIRDIDIVADYLLELQSEGMACIFRPLHEASGGWFWWGRSGAAPFRSLFQLIYDEMVNVKGVHNVIWVWNAGANDADWNPGDELFDIVSADIYNPDFDYSSNYSDFDKLKQLTYGKKIVTLSENGPIPDIQKMEEEEAMWSWWMPWYQTWNGNFVNKTDRDEWQRCMNDERVVTLEDMTSWDDYNALTPAQITTPLHTSEIYDLFGRRLTKVPHRGIYIRNNVKVLAR